MDLQIGSRKNYWKKFGKNMNKEELNQVYVKIDSILETATFKHDEDKQTIEMLRTQCRHYKKMYDFCSKLVLCSDSLVKEIKTAQETQEIINLKEQLKEANAKIGEIYMPKLFDSSAECDRLKEGIAKAIEELGKYSYLESSDFSQGYCAGLNKAKNILKLVSDKPK